MAFNISFYVSRTAVELLAAAAIAGAGIYLVNELIKEEENVPVSNPVEG